jgi:hypothetical protein
MYAIIEYLKSAFKHGVTKQNIRWALAHSLYDGLMEGYDNKYLAIGFDRNANLTEVMYNIIDEHTISVFHAMPCRDIWYPYVQY